MKNGSVQIAYAIHDYFGCYYIYLGISMLSIMKNTKESIKFHILCDDTLSEMARIELRELCEGFGQEIVFYEIELDERISREELLQSGYNEGIMYRLYLPELLPDYEKVLYLDVDILANGDVREIWDLDESNCAVIGRWDPPLWGFARVPSEKQDTMNVFWESTDWNQYVNSGVLVMNLKKIRETCDLIQDSIAFFQNFGMAYPDQDAINYILRGRIKMLPARYNMPNGRCRDVVEGYFYHYTYTYESFYMLDPIDRLLISYWQESPWGHAEADNREQVFFLRRFKTRADVYIRLYEMGKAGVKECSLIGYNMYIQGEFEEGLKWFSRAKELLEGEPDYGRDHRIYLMYYIAQSLRQLGRREEAIKLCEQELPLEEEEKGYLDRCELRQQFKLTLGVLYYENGQYENAEKIFKRCLYVGTEKKLAVTETALSYLFKCSVKKRDYVTANELNERLLYLQPNDERWRRNHELLEKKFKNL